MSNIYKNVNPTILFFSSIICFPTIFFQDNLMFLWANVVLFLILLYLKNGKIRLLPSLIILFSILFFNMLTPTGKIYASIGSFRITEGALEFGLRKAAVLLSMVFISQYAISRSLKLQGKLGFYLENMLYFLDKLTEHKATFNIKKPFSSIDAILLEVYETNDLGLEREQNVQVRQSIQAWLICIFPVLIGYSLLVLQHIY